MAEPSVVLVGVDGGASKTRAVAVAGDGRVLATSIVRSASAYHREPEEAAGVVLDAIREALAEAGVSPPVTALGAGLAGADDPMIHDRLDRALVAARVASTVLIDHDAAAALAGGAALAPGIVIVSGTGSVAFGVDAAGRRARAGGWGPLLDDEGSGYAVGRAVLRAAMRDHDGRDEATALSDAVRRRFGVTNLRALKVAVRGIGIDEVAAVAPLAVAAARDGDAVAIRILGRAGEGLASMVWAVARGLGWHATPFPLVTTGGMFDAGDLLCGRLFDALKVHGCPAAPTASAFPPEIGAALLAARAAGLRTDTLMERLSHG
jgi:N-acetylglucosamine kinase-like BadF-type ATPase